MRFLRSAAVAVVVALHAGLAVADSYLYEAVTDFQDITAGEVPYYLDDARDVLAIDAAIPDYRDKFARATTVFSGATGVYDVTITAIGEIDGEGEYRFLIDGDVVGSAVNQQVQTDWGPQLHVFEDIEITAGAVIGVESNARSNGLIPENGEFAFARGRWKTLQLELDNLATGVGSSVDLSVTAELSPQQVMLGGAVTLAASVTNLHAQSVATNIQLSVTLSDQLRFVSGAGCTAVAALVNCQLSAVAAGENLDTELTLETVESGAGVAITSVLSPQIDTDTDNNAATATVAVIPALLPAGSGETDNPAGNTDSGQTESGGSSGSGSFEFLLLAAMILCLQFKRRFTTADE